MKKMVYAKKFEKRKSLFVKCSEEAFLAIFSTLSVQLEFIPLKLENQ